MIETFRNFALQAIIPICLIMYSKSYKKATKDYTIPSKGGFRTEYSLKNIHNWRKTNNIAYRVNNLVICTHIIALTISMILMVRFDFNPTKLYVYTIAYMLLSHIISTMYIQYKSRK